MDADNKGRGTVFICVLHLCPSAVNFADAPPTLIQSIADAWSPWREIDANIPLPQDDETSLAWRAFQQRGPRGENWVSVVPRNPDFSKIRIRRIQGGEISVLTIDLEKAIRDCTDETTPDQTRLADIQLQRGDIIEIPLRENTNTAPWKGFSPETIRFFDKVLSARYVVIDPNEGTIPQQAFPQPSCHCASSLA